MVDGLPVSSGLNPFVAVDIEFQASATGTPSIWGILALGGDNGFIGQVIDLGGTLQFRGNTYGAITPGVWNDYKLVLDFPDSTESLYVNSTL